MLRKVYLEGELGAKFGKSFSVNAENMREVFGCLDANSEGFKKYLVDCHEKNIGFTIDIADKSIEHEPELLLPLKDGDVVITPVPAGSKGIGKILTAMAVMALVVMAPYAGPGAFSTITGTAATQAAGGLAVGAVGTATSFSAAMTLTGSFTGALGASISAAGMLGTMGVGLATNLAMQGLNKIMAPDPGQDADQESSYMFNGAEQNIIEGDPVPVLYGQLRVPGQPIVFDTIGGDDPNIISGNEISWMSEQNMIFRDHGEADT